jgi:hypothetical protein
MVAVAFTAVFAVAVFAVAQSGVSSAGGAKGKAAGATDEKLQYERAMAVNAVSNLMSRYSYLHLANAYDKRWVSLYANGDPDLKIEIASRGIWQGPDAAERLVKHYAAMDTDGGQHPPQGWVGVMGVHVTASPVIEVAGDGQTARGLWLSPGVETSPVGKNMPAGAGAQWVWVKFCGDFKKVNGEWRIWHLLVNGLFRSNYDQPWTEEPTPPPAGSGIPSFKILPFQPDRPPSVPSGIYKTSTIQKLDPAPPLPYETWDDSMSCVK